jgi:hypothetical protein
MKLNTFSLREPLPSSNVPGGQARTAVKVDLPESTLPITAILMLVFPFSVP